MIHTSAGSEEKVVAKEKLNGRISCLRFRFAPF